MLHYSLLFIILLGRLNRPGWKEIPTIHPWDCRGRSLPVSGFDPAIRQRKAKIPDTSETNGECRPRPASLSKAFNPRLDLRSTSNTFEKTLKRMPSARRKSSRLSPSPQTPLKMPHLSDPSRDYYSHAENMIAVAMKTHSSSSMLNADDCALDLKSDNAIPDLKHLKLQIKFRSAKRGSLLSCKTFRTASWQLHRIDKWE